MALVELLLSPLPAHVRTARLVAVAAARRAGLEDDLVDELRLAVGEACSRAVGLHVRHAPQELVRLTVSDDPSGLTLTVIDAGPAAGPVPDDPLEGLLSDEGGELEESAHPDVSLAVLQGLVDDVSVDTAAGSTIITLRWPLPAGSVGPRSTVVSHG
jgi:anti-sigma regulatory factor (Ser/Thr protein kinase)